MSLRLGIFAKTFPGSDPAAVLARVRDAGYEAAQFNMACCGLPALPDTIDQATLARIDAARQGSGVELCAMSGTFNMIHPDPAVRADGLRRLQVLAGATAALRVPMITLCTGTRDPDDQWRHHPANADPDAWRDLLASMEQAIRIAEPHGLKLGIEPELANVVASAARARRLIDELRSPVLAVVLDPANLFEIAPPGEQRRLVDAALDLLADRIELAHAKDRHPDGTFATAGKGVLDFGHYLAGLRRIGFAGPLVTHGLTPEEAPDVAAFLRARLP